jgi:hypothetical protein
MSSGFEREGYYEASQYLGQRVGKANKFLQKTSCMDIETRRLIAILEFIKEKHEDKETKQRLERMESFFEKLGNANWQRDVITDLALNLSIKAKRGDAQL